MTTTSNDRGDVGSGAASAGEGDAEAGDSTTRTDPAIAVRNLTKVFGDGEDAVRAVDGVSFEIPPGTVVGLLGPNGAGKTTTIKSMLGLVVPTEGEVEIAGTDPFENPREAYRRADAMLEGARNAYWRLTVRENLDFFTRMAGRAPSERRAEVDELLERFGIADEADTPLRNLSRGQKQKVSIASALSGDAEVIVLDEPTLGLDVESSLELRRELDRLVDEENLTVVLSSHDMDVIEDLCDRVVVVSDGEVVADDSVANLVDLFRTQAFEIAVAGDVPGPLERSLRDDYEVSAWERTGDRTRFEVSLPESNAIHELTGRLIEAELRIAAIDTAEPDFEEVFLSLTGRDASDSAELGAVEPSAEGDGRA